MTNLEVLITEPKHRHIVEHAIEEYISSHGAINKYTHKLQSCTDTACDDCIFKEEHDRCSNTSIEWLHQESEGELWT